VLLVAQSVVSFRSVPRILDLLNAETKLGLSWIPHFTSVINWTLRLGLGLLKQVKPISEPWLAIIDQSIDIGTKKALVVLRVSAAALSLRRGAICLEDCECIGLKVSEQITGETIAKALEAIFIQAGAPKAIIKDVALISRGACRLRQTECAFLIPPKLRSKGRFQSISTLGKWADKVLNVLSAEDRAQPDSVLAKLRKALPGFRTFKPFIQRFASTTHAVARVLEILKNQGLDRASFQKCWQICQSLPTRSKVKKRLQSWLQRHLEIQKRLTDLPLLVSSDIIESLFGSFKHIIERSPQADMNRTTWRTFLRNQALVIGTIGLGEAGRLSDIVRGRIARVVQCVTKVRGMRPVYDVINCKDASTPSIMRTR
jgi:hypothetical protein